MRAGWSQPMVHIRCKSNAKCYLSKMLKYIRKHHRSAPANSYVNWCKSNDTFTLTNVPQSYLRRNSFGYKCVISFAQLARPCTVRSHAGRMGVVNVIGATYKRNKCHAIQTNAAHVIDSRPRFSCQNYYLFISSADWLRKRFVISISMRFLVKRIYLI